MCDDAGVCVQRGQSEVCVCVQRGQTEVCVMVCVCRGVSL